MSSPAFQDVRAKLRSHPDALTWDHEVQRYFNQRRLQRVAYFSALAVIVGAALVVLIF